ncbi:hypothetical protein T07_8468 [Trichinella nelsoni]|uniref:Uncharacterized protein n=1 Tax=Trichinella nelsoni TaxID=6336 RepID=A0A0V0RS88_9BILA|nr:hypothetical protein T07_8468 [Trichinella nelsoni]
MASNVRISKYGSRQIVAANGERIVEACPTWLILGIDFLRPRRALIDLSDNKNSEDQNRGETQQECGICLLETVKLPAQTEMIVTGRSDHSWIGREGFFEPTPKLVNNHSVMAACSLSRVAGGTVPVRLLNGTDRPITLFKDTC